jgi:hypothetical protein
MEQLLFLETTLCMSKEESSLMEELSMASLQDSCLSLASTQDG